MLHSCGEKLSGEKLLLFWPEDGAWWEVNVLSFDANSRKHRLVTYLLHISVRCPLNILIVQDAVRRHSGTRMQPSVMRFCTDRI